MRKFIALVGVVVSLSLAPAAAEVRLEGTFIARKACPALQSIRTETNPGSIQTEPDRTYPLRAKNKPDATHYLIDVEGAEPLRRWVAVGCGDTEVVADGSAPDGSGPRKAEYVLAVSWQPAFCESPAGEGKVECITQSETRFDAAHFALHGLWPQGRDYCNVPPDLVAIDKSSRTDRRAWDKLPALDLETQTRQELERVMPGAMSKLDRHEWIKHGTCFGGEPPQAYFARTIALVSQLNASRVRDLFASNIGAEITREAIRQAFDDSFGAGAGARVMVACQDDGERRLIKELTIGLVGEIGDSPALAPLMAASAPPRDPGCPRGIVDPVGLQ